MMMKQMMPSSFLAHCCFDDKIRILLAGVALHTHTQKTLGLALDRRSCTLQLQQQKFAEGPILGEDLFLGPNQIQGSIPRHLDWLWRSGLVVSSSLGSMWVMRQNLARA
jgi:hypothetical protein